MGRADISVVICTHNPRAEYLGRVLRGLQMQTLPFQRWELLLIDNASADPVCDRFDIGWNPHARHVRENELGLNAARRRGIVESTADVLVFVDDDNVLDPDYLEQGYRISTHWSFLGTWGGQCIPEFEVEPATQLGPYLPGLALRTTERDLWTNVPGAWNGAYPYGAGLWVRRDVVAEVRRQTMSCRLRQVLDRKGGALLSGQDYDMNLTACEIGLGCGVFRSLRLTHLIPAVRVTKDYMLRLYYGHAFSNAVLFTARGRQLSDPLPNRYQRFLWKCRLRRQPDPGREFTWAQLNGTHDALRFCETHDALN